MIREAIQEIRQLADKAAGARVVMVAQEPAHVYYLQHERSLTRHEAEPQPRDHQVADLGTLEAICKEFASGGNKVAVWHGRGGIVAFMDDDQRRDKVQLRLEPSRQMAILSDWAKNVCWYEQAKLVQVLRLNFTGCLGGPAAIEAFRRLKFRMSQTGEKVVEHGRASIGKSLEAELTGVNTLPEELSFFVPAFEGGNLGVYASVHAFVEIDAQNERLAIVPEAGAVERAWLNVESELARRLHERLGETDNVHVYQGRP